MYFLFIYLRSIKIRTQSFLLKLFLLLLGCKVGKGFRCLGWPNFRIYPHKNIYIGNNVSIGKNITLQVQKNGKLVFEDNSKLTQDVIISVNKYVKIGKDSGVAEFCSIRDADHGYKKNQKMWDQLLISEEIVIGNDVQISRGCSVFRGAKIEDGVIIGANSMVFRNSKTIPYGIYMGNPLKLIGKRG